MERIISLVPLASPWHFLVLGHQGFLGNEFLRYFDESYCDFSTIPERFKITNIESLLRDKVTKSTIVVNCIASGVTPGTGGYEVDYQTNFELVKHLLDYSRSLGAYGFIHFASNYELPRHLRPLESRTPYVESKSKGSSLCLRQIALGRNVKLVYLPTVIGQNQPSGRFFKDFVTHLQERKPFYLMYPFATMEIVTIPSFFRQVDLAGPDVTWGSQEVVEDLKITVLGFAELLNELLEDFGLTRIELRYSNDSKSTMYNFSSKPIDNKIKKIFANQLALVLRSSNE